MKKIYILLFCVLYCISIQAQECGEAIGISTNPDNPINPHCTTKLNAFDWRKTDFDVPYYKGAHNGQIRSPFYNNNNGSTSELWNTLTFGPRDMLPEDGWELVFDGITQAALGTPLNSHDIAYFVLYNKFTATLRVFGAHHDINDRNDYMLINLEFDFIDDITGLLFPTQQIAQPLDEKSIASIHANAKISGSNSLYFFYADFPMGYDPCTCFFEKGDLKVSFQAINEQKLNIYGRSWAIDNDLAYIANGGTSLSSDYLTNVYSNGGARAGSLIFNTWGGLLTHYQKQKATAKKLKEQYQAFSDLSNALNLAASFTGGINLPNGGDTIKFKFSTIKSPLKIAAKFVDVLGAPLKKKVETATSAASATGKIRMIQSEMAFSGTLTDVSNKDDFSFHLPGRKGESDCNDPYNDHQYPLYNEVLGRFAVLETPKIKIGNYQEPYGYGRGYKFRLDETFKYMFNPAAKIDEANTEIYGAIVVKRKKEDERFQLKTYYLDDVPSLSNEDTIVHISPFLPLECLSDFTTEMTISGENASLYNGVYELQLRLFIFYEFDAINSQGLKPQAFEVLTYPLSQIEEAYETMPGIHQNGVGDHKSIIYETMSLSNTHYTASQTVFAWKKVIVDGDLTASPNVEINIVAPEIEINSGSIGQGITLTTGEFPVACSPLTPFDISNLESYCTSINSSYSGNIPKRRLNAKTLTQKYNSINFYQSPNPFSTTTDFYFNLPEPSQVSIIISDALGRRVQTLLESTNLLEGKHTYSLNGKNMISGVYFATIQSKTFKKTIKLIKQ